MRSIANTKKAFFISAYCLIFLALLGIILIIVGLLQFPISNILSIPTIICVTLGSIFLIGSLIAIIVLAIIAKIKRL